MANFVNNEQATQIITRIEEKFDAIDDRGALTYRGSVTFANLPATLTAAMTGYVYNVSDEFTTDARFVEGAGKKFPAGTDIAVANVGTKQDPDMKFNVGAGFIDTTAIFDGIEDTQAMIAAEFDETAAYEIGDVVRYEGALYRFKAAHAAGAWDVTEVDATTVDALIEAAEPDSLTTAQVNALLALLD